MYLKEVSLKKIRAFRSLRLNLAPRAGSYEGLTVITGSNGSGKTTLLRAIATALLGPDLASVTQTALGRLVSVGEQRGAIEVEVVPKRRMDAFSGLSVAFDPFRISLKVVQDANGNTQVSNGDGSPNAPKQDPRHSGPWGSNPVGWFCAGYGAYRRLTRNERPAEDTVPKGWRMNPFMSLFFTGTTLNGCENWLQELDYRGRHSNGKAAKAMLQSVTRFLNDGLMPRGLRIKRINPDGAWLARGSGPELPLSEMSDGERTTLALATDIVRQMEAAYSSQDLFGAVDGRTVVIKHGVVLIDELESHLHPEWQREIGSWLKTAFPLVLK